MTQRIAKFVRDRDYELLRSLGRGACGETVLLRDPLIDEYFVCKKFAPNYPDGAVELFERFKREIKILYKLQHQNVVRTYNHYLYQSPDAGYIIMEFIDGQDVVTHLRSRPQSAGTLFQQALDGFHYLEANKILHRDIRPHNLLVTSKDILKIIDFGFGKEALANTDFDKSVSLNWWCDTPLDFAQGIYDFRTEVYFVGKLFEEALTAARVSDFPFTQHLHAMCANDPETRTPSFAACRSQLLADSTVHPTFSEDQLIVYRAFANATFVSVARIETDARYITDTDDVLQRLEALYRRVLLEEYLPSPSELVRCLLDGAFYFRRHHSFPTAVVRDFLTFFRDCTSFRRSIVLANLHAKLDTKGRYSAAEEQLGDDVPF